MNQRVEWAVIPDFPEYSVSNLGQIRRDSSGRVLVYKVNQWGVVYVGLMRENRQYQRGVALLVANQFIEQPSVFMDTPINLNGDRYDNRVENIVWRSRRFARSYNRQFKDPYPYPITVPIMNIVTGEEFRGSWHCAISRGLLERDVVLAILNRTYTWPTYEQFGIIED